MSARRTLSADLQGTSTVELGMLAPFLALLILGTVDASRAASEKMRLQQAAARTIEMASGGGSGADPSVLAAEAAAAANVPANSVVVDRWLECDRARQPSFDGACTSAAEVGRYMSVSITQEYRPWFGTSLSGLGFDVSRTINLQGRASVRLQ
jgi:hypothetical protein